MQHRPEAEAAPQNRLRVQRMMQQTQSIRQRTLTLHEKSLPSAPLYPNKMNKVVPRLHDAAPLKEVSQ